MLGSNPQALVFYDDTSLVSLHVDLRPLCLGPVPTLNTTCSKPQKAFYDQLLISVHSIQQVIRRLTSLQGITNLIECDSLLRRYYFYIIRKGSQLKCKTSHFTKFLQQCRSWAKLSCQAQSPHERLWLRQRNQRGAWACSADLFGVPWWIWEHTGHSCSNNNLFGRVCTLIVMADVMATTQRMVHTIHGKQIYILKMMDKLTTHVNPLRCFTRY